MKERRIKKMLAIVTLFVLVTAVFTLTVPTNVGATTIIVDINGGGQYTSIQAAIDNATPGDTIRIWAGTYSESVVVDMNSTNVKLIGLKLIGNGTSNTIIDGGNLDVVTIKVDNVTIEGFTIQNSDNIPVLSMGCGIRLIGISSHYIIGCIIRNITIKDTERGMYFEYAGENQNNFNTIENIDCTASPYNKDDAIWLHRSNYNSVKNITIFQNQDNHTDGAVYLEDFSSYNSFDNITIYQNAGGDGFYIKGDSDDNKIINCTIHNTTNGISLHRIGPNIPSNNTIINNIIYDNKKHGIYLYNGDYNTIKENLIYDNDGDNDNDGDGIYLYSSKNNTIKENEIYNTHDGEMILGNQQCGIHLYNSDDNKIQNNDVDLNDPTDNEYGIHHNKLYGIFDMDGDNNTINNNICKRTLGCGIACLCRTNCAPWSINENYCNYNTQDGIWIDTCSPGTIINNNDCLYNDGCGITIHDSSNNNVITNNTISFNGVYGFQIHVNCNNNTITENTIEDNTEYGIHIYDECFSNTIYHNNFIDNNGAGETYDIDHIQAWDDCDNQWDNGGGGGAGEGNYWSDWLPPDLPDDDDDGIVDYPYVINEGSSQDNFPFTTISGWL